MKLIAGILLAVAALALTACSSATSDNAPGFTLPNAAGHQVELASLLQESDAVVLVFYRGFF